MIRLGPGLGLAALAWALFAGTGHELRDTSRLETESELLRVRLPLVVQLAYSGGDPYLAANTNVFRSLMVAATVTERETYRVQGQLQVDAARLNPWHEDNYYVGAAILPWNGQVEAAQYILLNAARARTWDMWPAFYYAFDAMYFEHDVAKAGHWAEVAATRHPKNAPALRAMAAAWYERGDDPKVAMRVLEGMFDDSRDENFRALLAARIVRLQGLLALREAAAAYRARHGTPPERIDQLPGHGGLQAVPNDPLRLGYRLDADGQPQLSDHMRERNAQ